MNAEVMSVSAFVLSVIGALSWVPFIWQKTRRPVVHGKILSRLYIPDDTITLHDEFLGSSSSLEGTCYLLKVSLTASKNPVVILDTKISVSTIEGQHHKAEFFYAPFYKIRINDRLFCPNLQPSDYFSQVVLLPENTPVTKYLLFCVTGQKNCIAPKIHLEIHDQSKRVIKTTLRMPSSALVAYEKDLLVPLPALHT